MAAPKQKFEWLRALYGPTVPPPANPKVEMSVPTAQDTGKFRKNTKDQFYTKAAVAKTCVDTLLGLFPGAGAPGAYQWIEPSAGTGAFLKAVPAGLDVVGLDIDPRAPQIQKGDFLDWSPTTEKRRIFFGNPPFGRQGSTAKAFIKHAAAYAEIIAFILPRSFVKPSMSRAFPPEFHCRHSEELPANSFEVNGAEYDVPCVFQIWENKGVPRAPATVVEPVGFSYVKPGETYHIAFKRAGGNAGKCLPAVAGANYNTQYHNFIRLEAPFVPAIPAILEKMNAHVFPSNTTGPRSLSKSEANLVLNEVLASCCADEA